MRSFKASRFKSMTERCFDLRVSVVTIGCNYVANVLILG